ncbi:32920_t:CDS:2, partial [Gigaspora margarita]
FNNVPIDSKKVDVNLGEVNANKVYCNDDNKEARKDKCSKSSRGCKSRKSGINRSLPTLSNINPCEELNVEEYAKRKGNWYRFILNGK